MLRGDHDSGLLLHTLRVQRERIDRASDQSRLNGGPLFYGDPEGYDEQRVIVAGQYAYALPSAMSRSTVLIGATTINGMLCREASTAALYVPTY